MFRKFINIAKSIRLAFGWVPRDCIICGHHGRFDMHGMPPRVDARCPKCGSLERHRLMAQLFQEQPELIAGRQVLHFAPDKPLIEMIQNLAARYETADADPDRAGRTLDIETIGLPDNSIDVLIANHVLEHVDDRKALTSIYKILKPGGTALFMVPLIEGWNETFEDPAIKGPNQKIHAYGQDNHVRLYGRDFRDRIRNAGFQSDEFTAEEPYVGLHGLIRGEKVFIARKES